MLKGDKHLGTDVVLSSEWTGDLETHVTVILQILNFAQGGVSRLGERACSVATTVRKEGNRWETVGLVRFMHGQRWRCPLANGRRGEICSV